MCKIWAKFIHSYSRYWAENEILTSFKGHNSVLNWRQLTLNHPKAPLGVHLSHFRKMLRIAIRKMRTAYLRLRDDSHKNQFLLGRFDWDGSHKISNGTVRTTLLGRFAQNLIYWDNSPFLTFKMKKKIVLRLSFHLFEWIILIADAEYY